MQCHLQCKRCHTYADSGVINTYCCDIILSGYYVLNTGDMMSQIYWMWYHHIVVVTSSIVWVWWHSYNEPEVRYSGLDVIHKVVSCPKEWMWCHIEEIWCHECSVCEVIEHDHWCHKVWMWCDVDWVWCHTCAKCDDLHTCDVIDTALHRYRYVWHLCDDTDTVAVVSKMDGEMSGIVVLSCKQYVDSVHIGYDKYKYKYKYS